MKAHRKCFHTTSIHILTTNIGCDEDLFEEDTQFSLLVEDVQVCTCGDLVMAFALMCTTYHIYNLSYLKVIQSTITFYQTTFLKIADGLKNDDKVPRLRQP